MLQISPGTLDALAAPREAAYVRRVAQRVSVHFPKHAAALGPQKLELAVHDLVGRGRRYGLVSEQDLYLYSCLGVAFGAGFDVDPRIPWMGSTLRSRILGSPSERVEQAYQLALAALRQDGRPPLALPDRTA